MTERARTVLDDARRVLAWLDQPQIDSQCYRIHWVTLCALLRAIGHVLEKVDAATKPALRGVVKNKWAEWKRDPERHAIFREFIEAERNIVLKTYEPRYFDRNVTIAHVPGQNGEPISYEVKEHAFSLFTPMIEGRYTGQDARDTAAEAIAWWDEQLTEIDRLNSSSNS